jgi:hypothetical protein
MNKRLEEFALECGAWHQVYEPKRFLHDHNFDIERFAELIVRECAGICHKMAEDSDSYVVHDGDTCAEQIKKHFGVEE